MFFVFYLNIRKLKLQIKKYEFLYKKIKKIYFLYVNLKIKFKYIFWTRKNIFTDIYLNNKWGDKYSLSGTGSELFSIDAAGNITLNSNFDFETASSYSLTLTVTDGVHQVSEVISITITDVNEAPTSSIAMTSSSFSEDVAVGTTIANASATDPEGGSITYTLTGEGSDKFTVDSNGNISLSGALDYETVSSFSFTGLATISCNKPRFALSVHFSAKSFLQ